MELVNIEKLLEKYLSAETTLPEEKVLQTYFTGNNVAAHLVEYQALFTFFATEKKERYTKTIHLNPKNQKWKWLSVAASIILMVGVYGGFQQNEQRKADEKLYAETQIALKMLASNLNRGTVAIGHLQQFENTKNKIFNKSK
ncbi:MAG: hypothetical protein COB81_06020 [Flavobacteriaceae bacterium]|nr:MAG: hypothetical protein COB81_06020 [Flavobacteriaceae bacterium]